MSSRAVLVVGMHRSGTSAVARGLVALSVYFGNDFLDAQPENPTGYWEDRGIVELNERVLKSLRRTWDGVDPIETQRFGGFAMWRLRRQALHYLRQAFGAHRLWGFKDPRTIRLLPFWRRVLRDFDAEDDYVVVIRNPLSVAASLYRRQKMDLATAQRLWLVYIVPFFAQLRDRPLVVVDYDLLMLAPRVQLERIAARLHLPASEDTERRIERFAGEFLNESLRHSRFTPNDLKADTGDAELTKRAYRSLYDLATDAVDARDASFWAQWRNVESAFAGRGEMRSDAVRG